MFTCSSELLFKFGRDVGLVKFELPKP